MRSTWFTPVARVAVALAVVATVVGAPPAAARPKPGVKRSGSNLFALTAAIMQVNHQYCPVINTGNVCTDPSGNGVIEGGFWPKGTPDSYIFNSGLQIGGNIPASAGFAWAGDTVGAFFMDPRGDQQDGAPITLVYNSLDAGDQASWPADGQVEDTAVYNSVLIGRNSVSQQDLWFRAWDGNPNKLGGRLHPMGVLVDVRGMAWNYPTGDEDIMYFVYTFTNVTSSDEADYDNPTTTNNTPTYRASLASIGAQFQQLNDTKYGITIPTHGYEVDSVFAAFFEDCDVGTDNVGSNYSTPVFPFSMGVCYEAPFYEATWVTNGSYDPTIFGAPFAAAPGFTSVKYLRSPVDSTGKEIGISMFSNTVNGATGYPDPVGIKQMYRYISGTSSPAAGDLPCTDQTNHQKLHYCVLWQTKTDTRFFQSSGPFKLLPAHSATIVVAYVNAPPVNNAALQANINGDFKPGFSATGDSIFKDPSAVRPIETVMGWLSQSDKNGDLSIEQNEVQTVPRSLLNKALVAQAVFDGKFLLPFAPDAPAFYLIPGDNQVTIVWQKSHTEDPATGGDPYFVIASDPTSALYDPDFRRFDLEGYRIYRGRTPGKLDLVAQFDYAGTEMVDYTGQFNWGNCAPELGVNGTTAPATCPVTFDSAAVTVGTSPSASISLVGNVIQVPPGGRVKLADGSILVTRADTAVIGGNTGFPPLADNGVAFAYVDRSVRNLFQYFYTVTAFDVNSIVSGPTSLESARVTKATTPRAGGANAVAAGPTTSSFLGANGVQLNASAPYPTLDPTTGEFSGPQPPTGAFQITGLAVYADQLILPNYTVKFSVDSMQAQGYHTGVYYVTAIAGADTQHVSYSSANFGDGDGTTDNVFGALIPADSAKSVAQGLGGLPFAGKLEGDLALSTPVWMSANEPFAIIGQNVYFGQITTITDVGGSRWFDGANEAMADPTLADGHGQLTGVTKIFQPTPNAGNGAAYATAAALMRRFYQVTYYAARSADVKFYWGTTPGTLDSVVDVSNHVPVPFKPDYNSGMSYGFLKDYTGTTAGSNTAPDGVISYVDALDGPCLPGVGNIAGDVSQAGCAGRTLASSATLSPTDASGDPVASDGQGFGLYVDGAPYFFLTTTLPASPAVWTLRTYSGRLRKSGGAYAFTPKPANPVPGISLVASTTTPASYPQTGTFDLSQVHTVPDPYYVTSALEITPNNKVLKFVNLPSQAIVRIYSVSGILVQVLTHNDPQGGGELDWDLRNRSNQFVASGVYFYHVEAANGQTKVGRFTVVQFAP